MFFEQTRMDHPGEEIPGPWIITDGRGKTVFTLFQEEDAGEEDRREGENHRGRETPAAGLKAAPAGLPASRAVPASAPGGPPSSPSGFLAIAESIDRVNLHWCHDGEDLEGFIVQRREEGGEFLIIDTLPGWAWDYIDEEGLLPGRWYEYRVGAYNEQGVSAYTPVAPVRYPAG